VGAAVIAAAAAATTAAAETGLTGNEDSDETVTIL
jgi:hypothetical protein